MTDQTRQAVFVVGMHRSGTSALAGLVNMLGAALPATLMPPGDDNPKGFFESAAIARLNERILNSIGGTWDNIPSTTRADGFTPSDLTEWVEDCYLASIVEVLKQEYADEQSQIVIKDPRICLFQSVWEKAAQQCGFKVQRLYIVREPEEVARSLWRRNRLLHAHSELLWAKYNAAALASLPEGTALIWYKNLIADPVGTLRAAGQEVDEELRPQIEEFAKRPAIPRFESYAYRPNHRSNAARLVLNALGDRTVVGDASEMRGMSDHIKFLARNCDEARDNTFRLPAAKPVKLEATPLRPRKVIFHHHLFKNAGTSVDHVLKATFQEKWNEQEFPESGPSSNSDAVLHHIVTHPEFSVFSSHTGSWFLDYHLDRLQVFPIIFLRHPILRIHSAYKFERGQTAETFGSKLAKSTDLAGYIRHRLDARNDHALENFQARRLAFFTGRRVFDVESQAHEAFERLPFIGMVEHFDASMSRMEKYLQPHFPEFEGFNIQKNVTASEGSTIDAQVNRVRLEIGDELFNLLEAANRIDIALFRKLQASYV